MVSERNITVKTNERVAFVGKTGSGKTFLAKHLLGGVKRAVIVDTKGTLYTGWNTVQWNKKNLKKLSDGEPIRLRIPPVIARNVEEAYDYYFEEIYSIGNVVVYIDELYGVTNGSRASQYLRALYTRGREFGIGVWACTQRPAWVPLFCISESEWLFAFRLQMMEDRKRMAELMGPSVIHQIPDKHGFYYMQSDMDNPVYVSQLEVRKRK
jgi:ABC-type dipeptide/oligopeptide/nickel transport system ATPase component